MRSRWETTSRQQPAGSGNVRIGDDSALSAGGDIGLWTGNDLSIGHDTHIAGNANAALLSGGMLTVGRDAGLAIDGSLNLTGGDDLTIEQGAGLSSGTGGIALVSGGQIDVGEHAGITASTAPSIAASGDALVGAAAQLAGGIVMIKAGNDVITAAGSTITADGLLSITANSQGTATSGAMLLGGDLHADGLQLHGARLEQTGVITATGDVVISMDAADTVSDGSVALGQIDADGQWISIAANGPSATITSLLDGPGAVNVAGRGLTLSATGSIGSAYAPLHTTTTVDELDVRTTGSAAGVHLVDTAGGLRLHQVTTGGGAGTSADITTLNGSLAQFDPEGPASVVAETVSLAVTGAGNTIGGAVPLSVDAGLLQHKTCRGNRYDTMEVIDDVNAERRFNSPKA